jgi:hypothetical protein
MELSKTKKAAAFTAAAATRIVSADGSMCASFEAGETRVIPSVLFDAALTHGMVPEGPLELEPPAEEPGPPQEEVISAGLIEACRTLIIRGNKADFTVVGLPRAASVKKLVDFHFTNKDVERAFSEALHEVEIDGDDSTEHSEPSSSVTE